LRNLTLCIERGHLKVASISVAPYASGLATLVEDELRLGVTVIDLGGGTTTIAVFRDGEMIFADAVALGGAHITNDIARGLATPMAQAERLKTLFGSALASPTDERETIDVPVIGETDNEVVQQVPRSALMGIIRPRVEETFEHVKGRLESAGMDRIAGRRVVITGGGSQLQGIREVAARLLDKQVRLGRPIRISGLAEATAGPAFSACAGLLRLAIKEPLAPVRDLEMDSAGGRLGRIGRWLKANF